MDFLRLADRIERHASRTTDLAIAPQLAFQPLDLQKRKAVIRETAGGLGSLLIALQPVMLSFLVLAPLADWTWGTALDLPERLKRRIGVFGFTGFNLYTYTSYRWKTSTYCLSDIDSRQWSGTAGQLIGVLILCLRLRSCST